jgi:crossover junction endodeoxyribonuclease RusA
MAARKSSQTTAPATGGAVPPSLAVSPVPRNRLGGSSPGVPPFAAREANGTPGSPRMWRIELPAGLKVLTLNDRLHWAEEHRRRQALKKAAWVMALNAKVPHLARAVVSLEYQPPDLRARDEDNMAASAKPCIDGLVAARVFNNDSSKYVSYGGCAISRSLWPKGRITIVITEAAGEAQ